MYNSIDVAEICILIIFVLSVYCTKKMWIYKSSFCKALEIYTLTKESTKI